MLRAEQSFRAFDREQLDRIHHRAAGKGKARRIARRVLVDEHRRFGFEGRARAITFGSYEIDRLSVLPTLPLDQICDVTIRFDEALGEQRCPGR